MSEPEKSASQLRHERIELLLMADGWTANGRLALTLLLEESVVQAQRLSALEAALWGDQPPWLPHPHEQADRLRAGEPILISRRVLEDHKIERPDSVPREGEIGAFDAGWNAHEVGLERETVRLLSQPDALGWALLGYDTRALSAEASRQERSAQQLQQMLEEDEAMFGPIPDELRREVKEKWPEDE